jgi:hypothetical protein
MKTFFEFMSLCEASDSPDKAKELGWGGGASVTRTGEGGRIGATRKKSEPERRRVKAVGGGKTEPVDYKPRKDIGQQRQASTRVQQPTQERGSADVKAKAAAAAKEERKKAALARIAAKKGGESPAPEKPKGKEVAQQASKLLSTKKPEQPVHPDYKPQQASGMTRAERDRARNQAKKELYNQKKAKLFADYKEVHGNSPTGKERTRLLALAHKALEG